MNLLVASRMRASSALGKPSWVYTRGVVPWGNMPTGHFVFSGALVGASTPVVWTPEDYRALASAANTLHARTADLMLVLYSESRLQPWASNPHGSGAFGLNQITKVAANAMKLTDAEWRAIPKMTIVDQLPLVVRFFQRAGVPWYGDAGAIYQVNAGSNPRSGSNDGHIVYPPGPLVAANPGLDADGDGAISVGDLRAHLRKLAPEKDFQAALAALRAAVPGSERPRIGEGGTSPVVTPVPAPPPMVPSPSIARAGASGLGLLAIAALALGGVVLATRS